jgi:hypothetical protein
MNMIPIFVPMKDGEALMPEVLQGVANQSIKCCIVPITSPGEKEYRETNRTKNLLRALHLCKSGRFILMDSDVVLGNTSMIEDMMMDEENLQREIVSVTTRKEKFPKVAHTPHALFSIRGLSLIKFTEYIEKRILEPVAVENDKKENCFICQFLFDKESKILYLENEKNYETERLDLTKEN